MVAATAIEVARELLVELPSGEARALQERWLSLRTVVYGVLVEGRPRTLTATQRESLRDRAVKLLADVAAAHDRFGLSK